MERGSAASVWSQMNGNEIRLTPFWGYVTVGVELGGQED
jgi:hypothetical protein